MRHRKATLVKKETTDGLVIVYENIELGKEYIVDLDTLETVSMYHVPSERFHDKEIVQVAGGEGWFATELLKIQEAYDGEISEVRKRVHLGY